MTRLPRHGPCLVCGEEGMDVVFHWDEEARVIRAEFTFSEREQGPPGHAHGGASAAVIDEAMGASVWMAGHRVVAAELSFAYRRPVPLDEPLVVEARPGEKDGRRVRATGELRRPDGRVLVTGEGSFSEAPEIFEEPGFGWEKASSGE